MYECAWGEQQVASLKMWLPFSTGMMSSGLSCEVCKFKSHKNCAAKAPNNCKWTTLGTMGKENIEEKDGVSVCDYFYHQLHAGMEMKQYAGMAKEVCNFIILLLA